MTRQQIQAQAAVVEVYYRDRRGRSFVEDGLSSEEALEALGAEPDFIEILRDVEDAVDEAIFRPFVLGPGTPDGRVLGAAEWLVDIGSMPGGPRP